MKYNYISIDEAIYQQIKQDLSSQKDAEVCGLLAGLFIDDKEYIRVDSFKMIPNIAKDSRNLFMMDPKEQMKFHKETIDNKLHVVGCIHSHPFNLGNPSIIDRSQIKDDYAWLIYGGQDDRIRSWMAHTYNKDFTSLILEIKKPNG